MFYLQYSNVDYCTCTVLVGESRLLHNIQLDLCVIYNIEISIFSYFLAFSHNNNETENYTDSIFIEDF